MKEIEQKVQTILSNCRASGNTTWILKSAINNPNCIIVTKSLQHKEDLQYAYNRLLYKETWYKKLFRKFKKHSVPKIVTVDDFVNKSPMYRDIKNRIPIIFDNWTITT